MSDFKMSEKKKFKIYKKIQEENEVFFLIRKIVGKTAGENWDFSTDFQIFLQIKENHPN